LPVLTFVIAVCGACVPLIFIKDHRSSCITLFQSISPVPLFLPVFLNTLDVPLLSDPILNSPPGIISSLGGLATILPIFDIADNTSFIDTIKTNYRNISYGGISMDVNTGESLIAWEASSPGILGPSVLNLATNLLYNRALNSTSGSPGFRRQIRANYAAFPFMRVRPMIEPSRWVFYFGAAMVRSRHCISCSCA
jgi:ATP-binding cassette subfamily A (ABC1) protein 3